MHILVHNCIKRPGRKYTVIQLSMYKPTRRKRALSARLPRKRMKKIKYICNNQLPQLASLWLLWYKNIAYASRQF